MASTIAIIEESSFAYTDQSKNASDSIEDNENFENYETTNENMDNKMDENIQPNSYAANKNTAEGLMDIALLSANANQLRFLVTYNHDASTYYISITLVALSLIMQILVGIALIFKRRCRKCRNKRYNEFVLGGVFMITVVNILLAAFTTTGSK